MEKTVREAIMKKREFSQLPLKDVGIAFSHFAKRQVSDAEKIRLTRALLHKVYASFLSSKLLGIKVKDAQWMLRKHLSTRERLGFYDQLYERIFGLLEHSFPPVCPQQKGTLKRGITVFDLGCGMNGFSFAYFPRGVMYVGVEAIGQLVDQMNNYFTREKLHARAVHESLFALETIQPLLRKEQGTRIVFLFKVLDSLEMMQRNYSKELLCAIVPLVDFVVVSFATQSMVSRKRFSAKRNWIVDFIGETFKIEDAFALGSERYVVFGKK